MRLLSMTLLFVALLLLAACTVVPNPADPAAADDVPTDPTPPPIGDDDLLPRSDPDLPSGIAVIDYSSLDLTDPDVAAGVARADLLVMDAGVLWSPVSNQGAVADLKARNPRLKVLGYINAHGSWLFWEDTYVSDPDDQPYGADWFRSTKPYWSYTTTGDTMMSWPGKVLLNVLDPDCRTAMVDVIVRHWNAHSNVLDGVFWDHFNSQLWTPSYVPGVDGEMDLDGDGIAHRDDEDEMAAYRAASEALITELRAALGPDIVQVANGARAATDSTFAGLLDGMMYENFPDVGFGGESMRNALDPANPFNLFAAQEWPRKDNGGPWLIYTNKYVTQFHDADGQLVRWRLAEYSRVAALLTGGRASYHGWDQKYRYDWPAQDVVLGEPLGPAVFDGDTITREFAEGRVTLTFTTGDLPRPFDFSIEQGGRVVQSLAYPEVTQ
jgi:hypothetical protein